MFILNLWEKVKEFLCMIKQFYDDEKDMIKNYYFHRHNKNNNKYNIKYEVAGARILEEEEKENIQVYLDKLFYAINDKNIHNIALSGGYGTGKSSIIKTLIKNHSYKKNKYIVISIGSFLDYKIKKDSGDVSSNQIIDIDELHVVDKIEESILKQLMHLNNYDDMLESDLKRIKSRRTKLFILVSIMFLFVNIFSYYTLTKFPNLYNLLLDFYYSDNLLRMFYTFVESYLPWHLCVLFLAFLTLIYVFAERIVSNNLVKSIKTEVAGIEIKGVEDLTFNRKLFEILYIIKQNRIESIFFEDIDRFSNDIVLMAMEELKELNTIINNSKVIRHDVTFIYEFKDDIFKKYTDRSKFYDYIISVMPLSTSSNSIYLLAGLLKNKNIDLDLIRLVCNHVTDYRTMVSIANDFNLFNEILSVDEQEINNLFATVVYKNVEVSDYNKLNTIDNSLDKSIHEINNEIEILLVDAKNFLDTVESLVLNGIIKRELKYALNGNYAYSYEWHLENLFVRTAAGEILDMNNSFSISLETFNDMIMKNEFDFEKYKYINQELLKKAMNIWNKYKSNNELLNIIQDNEDIKKKLLNRKVLIYSEDSIKIDSVFGTSMLVNDLIVSGFLNENYLDYVSMPVNNDYISYNDYKYISRVSHGYLASDFELNHIDSVVKHIKSKKYNTLRNYYLLDYLFENNLEENSDLLEAVLSEFRYLNNLSISFIITYKKMTKMNADGYLLFLLKLIEKHGFIRSLASYYESNSRDRSISLNDLICIIIGNVDLSQMKDYNDIFNKYLIENPSIIDMLDFSQDLILNNIKLLKFKIMDVSSLTNSNSKIIFDNNLYVLNSKNIEAYKVSFNDETLESEQFINYVLDNIYEFYNECYKNDSNIKINNKEVVAKIMSKRINKPTKQEIARRENYKLPKNSSSKVVINENADWDGIKESCDNGINHTELIKFIIDNSNRLFSDTIKVEPVLNKDFNEKLFRKMFSKNMVLESKKYYKEIYDYCADNKKYGLELMKFDYGLNYSDEINRFLISNQLMRCSKRNAQAILDNKTMADEDKARYFFFNSKGRYSKACFSLIQNNVNIYKELVDYRDEKTQIELLMLGALSKSNLIEIYPLIFIEDRYYQFKINEFNKIIKPNVRLFEVQKKKNYYNVKKK